MLSPNETGFFNLCLDISGEAIYSNNMTKPITESNPKGAGRPALPESEKTKSVSGRVSMETYSWLRSKIRELDLNESAIIRICIEIVKNKKAL